MPKIRGFKPDLWTDEDFVELSPFARLLWMGMWNYACDNGHLADKSKQIKMRVLPTDAVNCAELLRELEQNGRITRANGVITIPNFAKHQKPDKRYFQTCEVPGCDRPEGDSQRETRSGHHETTTGAPRGHTVGSWGPHVDGDGEVMVKGSDGDSTSASPSPSKPASRKRPAKALPEDWAPSDAHRKLAAELGVRIDPAAAKFRDHAAANDRRQVDWDAAFRTWLRNERPTATPALTVVATGELDPRNLPPVENSGWRLR